MHKLVQRCCLLLSFLAIFTLLKAQDPLPPLLPDCEAIQLSSTDNQLTISGLTAPISLVKVYDDAYNLVFECNGDCAETTVIENLNTCQTYKVEGTFFQANYEEICTFQQDILINGQTDGTTVCRGAVRLEDQAAVDAFCGCEIITGDLFIGSSNDNDITDISNLSGIQAVEGTFFVSGTKLTDLSALNIKNVFQGVDIEANALLESINILNDLDRTNTVRIRLNPKLKLISGFQNIKRIENLVIGGNENLVEIAAFGALELLYSLNFSDNNAIKHLNSFPELATCTAQVVIRQNQDLESMDFPKLKETAIVIIEDNPNLTAVGKFKNLNISFFLNVKGNLALTDCCFLTDLVDDDFDNGYVGGTITIQDNGAMCNTIEEILENCEETPPNPCDDSVCQGNVLLTSQAEVDAFCGCEVIEGNLVIGISPTEQSDIYSLANLSNLKAIKGTMSIVNIKVADFGELESLMEIGQDLAIVNNALLNSFKGLEKITAIPKNLAVVENPQLQNIDGLENIEQVGGAVALSINSQLKSIKGLSKLQKLQSLFLLGLSSLESLEGVQNIDSIVARNPNSQGFIMAGCPLITDLSLLQGLKYVEGFFTISENTSLADCCSISHLVDDNPDNGQVTGPLRFDLNPATCNSVAAILEFCDNPSTTCADIAITTGNNDLIISGITAPNSIVKVFNASWQLVFECNGDCEETISLTDLTAGDIYHTDIQFYDENWQTICDDRQDLEILGGVPCDDSICQGDVILNTQAEVDAFCGCEVIEGSLIIGAAPPNNALNDIVSIQNLIGLKQVKGDFTIVETQLTDLEGLDNLKEINSSAAFVGNGKLVSMKGLSNLTTVDGNLSVLDNIELVDLNGLENLSIVNLQLQIQGNTALTDISALSKIKKVVFLTVISNNSLKRLDGLEGLDSIFTSPESTISGVQIAGNDNLADISSLQNLKYVASNFTIAANNVLEDCCSITHLIDDNLTNGQILGTINIGDNPAFCNSTAEILARCNGTPPVSCDNITISTGNNDLIIEGITAPNSIVKVFDTNWQLVFECNGDCEETISFSDLTAGDIYHTDIQFYDENWQAICDDRQDINILGSTPCDNSICQGDVFLTTQAEVDAFCGCETIEGRLLIGLPIPNGLSDITSIANLQQLKSAKGGVSVVSTQLTSLEGLDNLVQSDGGMGLVANSKLTSLKGLNQLKSVSNLTLLDNSVLEHLDDLESLVEVNGQLGINTNNNLISIKGLSKITGATVVNIIGNESLPTLDGLENIATITSSSIQNGGLTVAGNILLKDISSLQGIKLIEGRFNLSGNIILEDCCAITHLIDEDDTNGQVLGDITISVNPAFCSSKEEILAKCGAPSSCDDIAVTYANNELKITGLTAPIEIVKVFDEDWQLIFECFADCEEEITLSNLSGNIFRVQIANYDEDWKFLCHGDQDITVAGSRNIHELLPEDFTLSPNPAYEHTTIDLNRLLGETVDLIIYNQFGQEVFEKHIEKVGTTKESIDLSTIANGFYLLKIQPKGKRSIAKKLMVSRLY